MNFFCGEVQVDYQEFLSSEKGCKINIGFNGYIALPANFLSMRIPTVINFYIFDQVIYFLSYTSLLQFSGKKHSNITRNKSKVIH